MARPRIEIDERQFEELCKIQCTKAEISAVLGASEDTLDRWCFRTFKESFASVYKKKAEMGKMSLRRTQIKMAEKFPNMAIWLGKQYLGQRDNPIDTSAVDEENAAFDNVVMSIKENPTNEDDSNGNN